MKFKCIFAGKRIEDESGQPYACIGCSGILVKKGKQLALEKPITVMLSLPRAGIVFKNVETFSCPATVVAFDNQGNLSEQVAKIVEVI